MRKTSTRSFSITYNLKKVSPGVKFCFVRTQPPLTEHSHKFILLAHVPAHTCYAPRALRITLEWKRTERCTMLSYTDLSTETEMRAVFSWCMCEELVTKGIVPVLSSDCLPTRTCERTFHLKIHLPTENLHYCSYAEFCFPSPSEEENFQNVCNFSFLGYSFMRVKFCLDLETELQHYAQSSAHESFCVSTNRSESKKKRSKT